MDTKYVKINEIPNPICWWSDRLGEVCEVLDYFPETDFYKIRIEVDGMKHWGGIPAQFCQAVTG